MKLPIFIFAIGAAIAAIIPTPTRQQTVIYDSSPLDLWGTNGEHLTMSNGVLHVGAHLNVTGTITNAALAGCAISADPNGKLTPITMGILSDADSTLIVGASAQCQIINAALGANRTITLSTVGAVNGSAFTIVRKGLGLFTLNIGGLKIVPSATAATVTVMFDGSAWQLIGYQLL
jgi:hypothetical protein